MLAAFMSAWCYNRSRPLPHAPARLRSSMAPNLQPQRLRRRELLAAADIFQCPPPELPSKGPVFHAATGDPSTPFFVVSVQNLFRCLSECQIGICGAASHAGQRGCCCGLGSATFFPVPIPLLGAVSSRRFSKQAKVSRIAPIFAAS